MALSLFRKLKGLISPGTRQNHGQVSNSSEFSTPSRTIGSEEILLSPNTKEISSRTDEEQSKTEEKGVLAEEGIESYFGLLKQLLELGPLFITGQAGTGKSTLVSRIVAHLRENGKKVAVVAPTGIAALNARGETIHSFFRYPPKFVDYKTLSPAQPEILSVLDYLIIDEVSMVRADMMDCIHVSLCHAKRLKDLSLAPPFGGVKVLLVGDLYQLPPIVTSELQPAFSETGEWKSPYFFDAHCLREHTLACVELTKVHRLSEEPGRDEFLACLGKVREGAADAKILDQLHRAASIALESPIHLTGTRAKAEKINLEQLEKLNAYPRTYIGRLEGQIEYKENDFPSPLQLTLKEGAQVMITKNVSEHGLVNGMMGVVEQMGKDTIAIRLKGETRNNEIVTLTEEGWDQHKHTYNREKKEILAEKTGTFYQFPLKLGWAVTIHKSQGLTLAAAVLDIDRAFAFGQIYVALSRVRRLKDLAFANPLSRADIKADARIGHYLASRVDYKLQIQ